MEQSKPCTDCYPGVEVEWESVCLINLHNISLSLSTYSTRCAFYYFISPLRLQSPYMHSYDRQYASFVIARVFEFLAGSDNSCYPDTRLAESVVSKSPNTVRPQCLIFPHPNARLNALPIPVIPKRARQSASNNCFVRSTVPRLLDYRTLALCMYVIRLRLHAQIIDRHATKRQENNYATEAYPAVQFCVVPGARLSHQHALSS